MLFGIFCLYPLLLPHIPPAPSLAPTPPPHLHLNCLPFSLSNLPSAPTSAPPPSSLAPPFSSFCTSSSSAIPFMLSCWNSQWIRTGVCQSLFLLFSFLFLTFNFCLPLQHSGPDLCPTFQLAHFSLPILFFYFEEIWIYSTTSLGVCLFQVHNCFFLNQKFICLFEHLKHTF